MFSALAKAIGQLSDPRARRVVWLSLALSFLIFVLLWVGAAYLIGWGGEGLVGWLSDLGLEGWLLTAAEWITAAAGGGSVLFISFLIFPGVVSMIIPLFLDSVAEAVEERHYPGLPEAREQPMMEMLGDGLRFALITVGANLLALPVYILTIFIPGLNLVLYYTLNGYLLGREYYEMVAVRRLTQQPMRELWRARKGRFMIAGAFIALMLSIPFVNIFAPVVATAFMVHIFEKTRRKEPAAG